MFIAKDSRQVRNKSDLGDFSPQHYQTSFEGSLNSWADLESTLDRLLQKPCTSRGCHYEVEAVLRRSDQRNSTEFVFAIVNEFKHRVFLAPRG